MAAPTYATRDDAVIAAGGVARLVQLSDFDDSGQEDSGLVDDALCEAEGVINSYVRKRFEVPIPAPIPETIRNTCRNMAIYILKSRRDAVTEKDAMEQTQRIEWLEGIASGKVDPGVAPKLAKSPHNSPRATERPTSKAVSRKNLEGFS